MTYNVSVMSIYNVALNVLFSAAATNQFCWALKSIPFPALFRLHMIRKNIKCSCYQCIYIYLQCLLSYSPNPTMTHPHLHLQMLVLEKWRSWSACVVHIVTTGWSGGRVLRRRRQCEVRPAHGLHHHHALMEHHRVRPSDGRHRRARPRHGGRQVGHRLPHQSPPGARRPLRRGPALPLPLPFQIRHFWAKSLTFLRLGFGRSGTGTPTTTAGSGRRTWRRPGGLTGSTPATQGPISPARPQPPWPPRL